MCAGPTTNSFLLNRVAGWPLTAESVPAQALIPDTVLLGTRCSPGGNPTALFALFDGSEYRVCDGHDDRQRDSTGEEIVPRKGSKGIHA